MLCHTRQKFSFLFLPLGGSDSSAAVAADRGGGTGLLPRGPGAGQLLRPPVPTRPLPHLVNQQGKDRTLDSVYIRIFHAFSTPSIFTIFIVNPQGSLGVFGLPPLGFEPISLCVFFTSAIRYILPLNHQLMIFVTQMGGFKLLFL